ncbi:LysR family transcriptional regulator [Nonomuraea sp. NPDC002799]
MIELDLRRLRFLRELEERGTLAAVAATLGYSPSTISQQLALLEKEVGARLLDKAGRGVRLTDAGHLLAQHARVLLSAAEAAEADLATLGGAIRGTVRAGGLQSAARRLLIPAVARMKADHPQVAWRSSSWNSNSPCQIYAWARSTSSSATSTTATPAHARPDSASHFCSKST